MSCLNTFSIFGLLVVASLFINQAQAQTELSNWPEQLASTQGKERLQLLTDLTKAYYQINLDSSLIFAQAAVGEAQMIGNDSLLANAYLRLCPSFHFMGQTDSVTHYAKQGLAIGERIASEDLQGYACQLLATTYRAKQEYEQAITFNQRSLAHYTAIADTLGIVSINNNLTHLYNTIGEFDLALDHAFMAERWSTAAHSPRLQGQVARNIADVYRQIGAEAKYNQYLRKALRYHTREDFPRRYAHLLMNLGANHQQAERYDSTTYYYEEALAIYEELGATQAVAVAYGNLGGVYLDKKDWNRSRDYLHKAWRLKQQIGDSISLAYDVLNLGLLYSEQNSSDSATYYLYQSLELAEEMDLAEVEEETLKALYEFYEKAGNYRQAFTYHRRYTDHLEQTKSTDIQERIAELEAQYESEKKDREIERLAWQTELADSKTQASQIGFGSTALLAVLLAGGIFYRRQKEQRIHLLQQQVNVQEKKKMDQELEHKTKQLTAHALHMVQKNKILQEVKQDIGQLAKGLGSEQRKAIRNLAKRIDFNLQSDEDWDTFRLYFEQINRDFYDNLAKINDGLTSTDLKLCSLIRLNMNIKETASVLNIEPTSVKTARHRLRKKLGVMHGQDLTSFIRRVA